MHTLILLDLIKGFLSGQKIPQIRKYKMHNFYVISKFYKALYWNAF